MKVAYAIAIVATLVTCTCTTTESGTLQLQLAFQISGETGLVAARDLTVDHAGNIYIFDYDV